MTRQVEKLARKWTCPICSKPNKSYKQFQSCYYGHAARALLPIRASATGRRGA